MVRRQAQPCATTMAWQPPSFNTPTSASAGEAPSSVFASVMVAPAATRRARDRSEKIWRAESGESLPALFFTGENSSSRTTSRACVPKTQAATRQNTPHGQVCQWCGVQHAWTRGSDPTVSTACDETKLLRPRYTHIHAQRLAAASTPDTPTPTPTPTPATHRHLVRQHADIEDERLQLDAGVLGEGRLGDGGACVPPHQHAQHKKRRDAAGYGETHATRQERRALADTQTPQLLGTRPHDSCDSPSSGLAYGIFLRARWNSFGRASGLHLVCRNSRV